MIITKKLGLFLVVFSICLILILVSCQSSNNNRIHRELVKEFRDSVEKSKATYFDFEYDGLVPQESYFVDGKLKYLKFEFNPEAGYAEGYVSFDSRTDSIDRYILRVVTPEWKTYNESIFDTYYDTLFVIYPSKNVVHTYANNSLVDSFQNNINDYNIEFVYKMKHGTEMAFQKLSK